MKKSIFLIPIIALALISCGGGESETADGASTEENAEMTGILTDLSEYGMDFTIILPDKKGVQTQIMATDWGGIEIKQGEMFILSIAYGEGDLDLLKFDMEEDLVYKSQILDESPDHIVYKREIEGSGMDPEFHFMYIVRENDEAIEAQNSKDVNFNEEAIRAMLSSAKTLKAKTGA